jgi:hypothetical protein
MSVASLAFWKFDQGVASIEPPHQGRVKIGAASTKIS